MRAGLLAGTMALLLGTSGCEDNICKKAMLELVQREEACYGIDDLGPVPDDVACPEEKVDRFECLYQCFSLPCDTPVEEYNNCISSCGD